jgi:hypothetical protein
MDLSIQELIKMNDGVVNIHHVIHVLSKGKTCEVINNELIWIDDGDPPTEKQINDAIEQMQIEYDAQKYIMNRVSEYPSTGDQLDMIYKDTKNSTTTHADVVEAVKTKWPKDNSGPVE